MYLLIFTIMMSVWFDGITEQLPEWFNWNVAQRCLLHPRVTNSCCCFDFLTVSILADVCIKSMSKQSRNLVLVTMKPESKSEGIFYSHEKLGKWASNLKEYLLKEN